MKRILTLIGLLFSVKAFAVILAWGPSASAGITNYAVYWGPSPNSYTNAVSVGNVLTGTIEGLAPGSTQYFAVTCMATNGLQSDFSDELAYTVPSTNIIIIGQPVVRLDWYTNKSPIVSWQNAVNMCDTLQVTTNLVNWSNISRTFYATNLGRVEVRISSAPPRRYFRVYRSLTCP